MSLIQTDKFLEAIYDRFNHLVDMKDFDGLHALFDSLPGHVQTDLRFTMNEYDEKEFDAYVKKLTADCPHNFDE